MIDWRVYFSDSTLPISMTKVTEEACAAPEAAKEGPSVTSVTNFGHAQPLEDVLKGKAVELWSDALGERFWLVADEEDAAKLGEPRGTVYTAAEARRVVQIGDPATVAEIHRWKRRFDAKVREAHVRKS